VLELGLTILVALFHSSKILLPNIYAPSYITSLACATLSNLVLLSCGGLKVSSFNIALSAPVEVYLIL